MNTVRASVQGSTTIPSGGSISVRLDYRASSNGDITVQPDNSAYSVQPSSVSVSASENESSVTPSFTVSGPAGQCRLSFFFRGDKSMILLTVSSPSNKAAPAKPSAWQKLMSFLRGEQS